MKNRGGLGLFFSLLVLTLPVLLDSVLAAAEYSNDFNEAADTKDWVVVSGRNTWHREANRFVEYPAFAPFSLIINQAVGDTAGDITVSAVIQLGGDNIHGFALRRPTLGKSFRDNDFYFLGVDHENKDTSTLKIVKYMDGAVVAYVFAGGFSVGFDTDYRLEAAITGNVLSVALKDATGATIQSLNWTDPGETPVYTHGYVGLMNGGTTGRFDDFNVVYTPAAAQ